MSNVTNHLLTLWNSWTQPCPLPTAYSACLLTVVKAFVCFPERKFCFQTIVLTFYHDLFHSRSERIMAELVREDLDAFEQRLREIHREQGAGQYKWRFLLLLFSFTFCCGIYFLYEDIKTYPTRPIWQRLIENYYFSGSLISLTILLAIMKAHHLAFTGRVMLGRIRESLQHYAMTFTDDGRLIRLNQQFARVELEHGELLSSFCETLTMGEENADEDDYGDAEDDYMLPGDDDMRFGDCDMPPGDNDMPLGDDDMPLCDGSGDSDYDSAKDY